MNHVFLASCSSSLPSCKNSGVRNHRCECYCPDGFTGSETVITDPGKIIIPAQRVAVGI